MKSAVVALLLVAGCGDPVQQSDATRWTPPSVPGGPQWTARIEVDRGTGAMSAPGFNALIDAERPGWAQAADTTVAELLDLHQGVEGPGEVYLLQDDPHFTVTLSKLGDDSIQAIRYRITLRRGDDGRFRFVAGEWTQRCHSGRGHQDFATARCS
ncbi:hypothetical protein AB0H83_22265 [Dactylosporangium sp. NPDC050688]|uniref:hypothetical protein n=1 Tax=Dactylosporangium sp. NPDC050688 TaxID=3157217 RepID=UPI0033D5CE7A